MNIHIDYRLFKLFAYYIIEDDKPVLNWGLSILRYKYTALLILTRWEVSLLWLFRIPAPWQWKFKGLAGRLIKNLVTN